MADTPSLPDGPALIVVGGPTDGEIFPLEKDRSVIAGSGRLANLRLGPADISSAHIKVTWDDTGLYVIDNASHTGTFVNGEPMEMAPLMDGDLITFADPLQQPDWPKLRLHVPAGSVIVTAPPPEAPPAPEAAKAPEPVARGSGRPPPRPTPRAPSPRAPARGKPRGGFSLPALPSVDPKLAGAVVGGVAGLVLLVWLLVWLFFGPTPSVASAQPVAGEAGVSVTLVGDRFSPEPAQNVVRFGEATAKVTAAGETSLTVVVPDAAVPGDAVLTVQVGRRRSKPVSFQVLKVLRISALEPDVALPGEEVTVKGAGLDNAGLVLSVEGKPTQIFDVQTTSLRFRVPALATDPVRSVPVLLKTKEQVAKPVELTIGKLPLVLGVSPKMVEAGDRVTLKGRGFAPDPGANRVHVGRALALVLQSSPTELTVVAPDLGASGPAVLTVEAAGRSNSAATPVQVGAGSSSTYRLRFYAAPTEVLGQVFVSTVAGPMLLVASKDDAPSVEERAAKAALTLGALADTASAGRPAAVEARNPPALAVVGGDVVLRVTPEDAAAYANPPGVTGKATAPTPAALAAHWAALVGDALAMFAPRRETDAPLRHHRARARPSRPPGRGGLPTGGGGRSPTHGPALLRHPAEAPRPGPPPRRPRGGSRRRRGGRTLGRRAGGQRRRHEGGGGGAASRGQGARGNPGLRPQGRRADSAGRRGGAGQHPALQPPSRGLRARLRGHDRRRRSLGPPPRRHAPGPRRRPAEPTICEPAI